VGTLAASAVLIVGVAGKAAGAVGAHPARPERAAHSYVVRSGDTVWSIASTLAGRNADPRPLVDRIVADNGLPPTLRVGTRLLLPSGS
jgi:Tfp pilus assembly protein FimV